MYLNIATHHLETYTFSFRQLAILLIQYNMIEKIGMLHFPVQIKWCMSEELQNVYQEICITYYATKDKGMQ